MPHALRGFIESFARVGYTAKGVVYGLVGVLALQSALRAGDSAEGTRGALTSIGLQPFGRVLLALVALGLLSYVLWCFGAAAYYRGLAGERRATVYGRRLALAGGGLLYLGLALAAARLALGVGGSGEGSEDAATQTLMQQPFGRVLVGLVGLAILGVALSQFYRAYKAAFMRLYDTGGMSTTERTWAERLGRFGLSARGVTFLLIGFFFLQAAWRSDPREAGGLSEAFDALAAQPYGPYLLATVALGFAAYGLHCLAHARYCSFDL